MIKVDTRDMKRALDKLIQDVDIHRPTAKRILVKESREARKELAFRIAPDYPRMRPAQARRRIHVKVQVSRDRLGYAAVIVAGRKLIVHVGRIFRGSYLPKRGKVIRGRHYKNLFWWNKKGWKKAGKELKGERRRLYFRREEGDPGRRPIKAVTAYPFIHSSIKKHGNRLAGKYAKKMAERILKEAVGRVR